MKRWYHNRKLLLALGVLLSLSLVLYSANPIFAQSAPTASGKGAAFLGALSGIGGIMTTFVVIGQAVRMLGGVLLTIAAHALDFAFQWNTTNIFTNDVSGEPLTTFWGYARDLVNGLLILILLWIAFGIIFNLERFNARRLLVRVILVGLLINFSLTLTSSVFSLANALAQPFAEQLKKSGGVEPGKTDPATGGPVYRGMSVKIVEITNIHNVMNAASKDVQILKNLAERQEAGAQISVPGTVFPTSLAPDVSPYDVSSEEIVYNTVPQLQSSQNSSLVGNDAEAQITLALPVAYGILKFIGISVAATSITSFLEQFVLGQNSMGAIGTVSSGAWALFLNPFVGGLFLLVATFVVGSLAIVFMVRGIVIMILAILSPLAFVALVIPGQDKYFKMWMGKLINWSFFAPISFFLLLFAMHVGDKIQEASAAAAKSPELQANLPAAFQFALILGLLISALAIAKYMGIQLAATLMSAGEKYAKTGLGVAKGFAKGAVAGAIMPRLGAVSSRLEEAIGRRSPALQRALSIPTAGLRKVSATSRKEVEGEGKNINQMTAREIKRTMAAGGFLTLQKNMAAARRLQELGDLGEEQDIRGYSPAMLDEMVKKTWQSGGEWQSFAKVLPTLAKNKYLSEDQLKTASEGFKNVFEREAKGDEAAAWFMWNRIKPPDMAKMDYSTTFGDLKDPNNEQGRLMAEMYMRTARGEHHSQFARTNPAKAQDVIGTILEKKPEIIKSWNRGQYAYWSTNTARELGLSGLLPAGAEKPKDIVKEEELRKAAEDSRLLVRDTERKLEQVKRIEERSKELETKRDALRQSLEEVRRKLAAAADAEERRNLDRSVADINKEIRRIEDIDLPTIEKQKGSHISERRVTDFSEVLRKYGEDIETTRENLRKTREELRGLGGLGGRIDI